MTIWLLALLLMASLAALGYRQGAIRVGFSFIGILLGILIAPPLGRLLKGLLIMVGLKNVLLAYLLGPVIVFIIISIIFKIAAAATHRKVEVYYKYKAGDLRLALWERLNHRLGLCLGFLNASAYLAVLAFVIYSLSYATYQLSSPEGDPTWMRLLNRMGKDLETTGFAKVGRALDSRQAWYDTADLAGFMYANPLLEARLARYPAFLSIAERQEFKDLSTDKEFLDLRQGRGSALSLWDNGRVRAIAENPELLATLWATVLPNIKDLRDYLVTGLSSRFDSEKILGRWNFDVNYAMILMRRARPNMTALEAQKIKKWMSAAFAQTSLVAMPERQVVIKNLPQVRIPVAAQAAVAPVTQNLQGQWKTSDGKYQISLSGGGDLAATIEGDRLRVNYDGTDLVFDRET